MTELVEMDAVPVDCDSGRLIELAWSTAMAVDHLHDLRVCRESYETCTNQPVSAPTNQ